MKKIAVLGTAEKKVDVSDTSYIVFPQEALLGCRLEGVKAWTAQETDAWIALPAVWRPDERCWEVTLDVVGKPPDVDAAQRDGWRTLTKWDVPSGLYPVRVNIRRQRWRTPEGTMLSPIPAYFGTQEESSAGQRGRPPGSSRTPGLEAFQQIARVVLRASASLIRRRLSLPGVVGTSDQEPRAWLTRRPTTLPEHLTIDELWIQQTVNEQAQRMYWTVVSDNSLQATSVGYRVLGLCQGRDVEQIKPMLREIMGWYPHGLRPSHVSVDMWRSFREAMEAVSPQTKLLFDRFHFERHINQAMFEVWADCTDGLTDTQMQALENCSSSPCSCGLRHVCQRWQYALSVAEHFDELWTLSSEVKAKKFLKTWDQLSSTRRDDFSKVKFLLKDWRDAVDNAAFLRGKGGVTRGTAMAEYINRELRRVIRQHRLTPLERSLDQLFDLLHTARPLTRDITAMPLTAGLVCPKCGATGPGVQPAADVEAVHVRHLPHGLDRVTLVLPSAVDCAQCGVQAQLAVSGALAAWLQEPAQLALSQAELVRLTGLPARDIRQQVQACLDSVPASSELPGNVLVYSELWTSTRVWLVLTSPAGGVVEMVHVPIPTGDPDDPGIHEGVAARARALVEPYLQQQPPAYLHLTTQTGKLGKALESWIWKGRVTLKEFVLRSLVIKFRKQALRLLRDTNHKHATLLQSQIEHATLRQFQIKALTKAHIKAQTKALTRAQIEALTKAQIPVDLSRLSAWELFKDTEPHLADLLLAVNEMERAIMLGDRRQIARLIQGSPFFPRDIQMLSMRIQKSMWSTCTLWSPAIDATLARPTVNVGYEPTLMARIREHLQTSPALHPERQRRRLLLLLREEERARQEARRKRR